MKKRVSIVISLILCVALLAITPVVVSAAVGVRGDTNADGYIDMKDILSIRRYVGGVRGILADIDGKDGEPRADVNGDDSVDMKDVLMIRKYVADPNSVTFAPYGETTETTSTTIESTTTTTEAVVDEAIIRNGAFDRGDADWTISGSATVANGKLVISNCNTTNTIVTGTVQTEKLSPNTTYTITADITGSGVNTELIVTNTATHSEYISANGSVTFTTGASVSNVGFKIRVLSSMSTGNSVTVDNVVVTETHDVVEVSNYTLPTEEETSEQETSEEEHETGTNLIQNGKFDGTSNWTNIGAITFTTSNNVATVKNGNESKKGIGQYITFVAGHEYEFSCDVTNISGGNLYLMGNTSLKIAQDVGGQGYSITFTATAEMNMILLGGSNREYTITNVRLIDKDAPNAAPEDPNADASATWESSNGISYVHCNGTGEVEVCGSTAGSNGTWAEFIADNSSLAADKGMTIWLFGKFIGITNGSTLSVNGIAANLVSANSEEIQFQINGPCSFTTNGNMEFVLNGVVGISANVDTNVYVVIGKSKATPSSVASSTTKSTTSTTKSTTSTSKATTTSTTRGSVPSGDNILWNGDFHIDYTGTDDENFGWKKDSANSISTSGGVCTVECGNEDKKGMSQTVAYIPGHIYKITCTLSDYSGTLNFYSSASEVRVSGISAGDFEYEWTAGSLDTMVKFSSYNKTYKISNVVLLDLGLDPDYDPNAYLNAYSAYAIDQISLAFNDITATDYGVTWHTYVKRNAPVLQLVEGNVTNEAQFASLATNLNARVVEKTTTICDYNSTDFTFNCVYQGQYPSYADYINKVDLTGLKYNTTYSYRVGDTSEGTSGVWSPIYTFTTRPQTVGDYSFTFISDSQYGTSNSDAYQKLGSILTAAQNQIGKTPFLFHGGDICDEENFAHLYRNMLGGNASFFTSTPAMCAIGNHDSVASTYTDHWNADNISNTAKGYYSFNYGAVHFIVLNTEDRVKSGETEGYLNSSQYTWLASDLAANDNNPQTKWIIVTYHRPVYAPFQANNNKGNSSNVGLEDPKDINCRTQLMGLFSQYGVDLVMQAHTHQYFRSYPIKSDLTPQTNYTTENIGGVNYIVNPQGPIFGLFSTAGDDPDPIEPYDKAAFTDVEMDGQARSWANVSVTDTTLTIKSYYLGKSGGTTPQLYESYGIKKTN